jgi:hypothetical protein
MDPLGLDEHPSGDTRSERAGGTSDAPATAPQRAPFAAAVAALRAQPTDLAGELDWPGYAVAFEALLPDASAAEIATFRITEVEQMRLCKRSDGDTHRRMAAALNARARELQGEKAA